MPKEIEMKVIGVDGHEAIGRLKALGARHVATRNFKRIVIDLSIKGDFGRHLRLRTDGKESAITLKIVRGKKLSQTDEYEVKVGDFATAAKILCSIHDNAVYMENRREEYSLGGVTITLDSWPFIPPLIEIEGKSERAVVAMYKKLNVAGTRFGNVPVSKVYAHYGLDYLGIARKNGPKLRKLLSVR